MRTWSTAFGIPVEIREDDRFLCARAAFADWAKGRNSLRMEFFYRQMRRKTGWLMNGDQPAGRRWNYDAENRKALPPHLAPPPRHRVVPDAITREVMTRVEQRFSDHFGDLDSFGWAVTREEAIEALLNETRLKTNPRMALPYRTLARMADEHRRQIVRQAQEFLAGLDSEQT